MAGSVIYLAVMLSWTQLGGAFMKSLWIVLAAVVLSAGAAQAWSEQNCMMKCRLTAATNKVQLCQTRDGGCARFAGGKHESEAYVRQSAATWKARGRGYWAGSMYEGKMSGSRTWRNRQGRCPARAHSAGYC